MKDLGQFAESLGSSVEEFVIPPARTAQSEPVQAKVSFEVREEHFDLLAQLHRDHVLFGPGDTPSNLLGVFMFLAGDLTRAGVWAASRLGWAV